MVSISSTFNNQKVGGSGIQILGTEGTIELGGGQLVFTPEIVHEDNGWIVNHGYCEYTFVKVNQGGDEYWVIKDWRDFTFTKKGTDGCTLGTIKASFK